MKELLRTIVIPTVVMLACAHSTAQDFDTISLEHRSMATGGLLPNTLVGTAQIWTDPDLLVLPAPTSLLQDDFHYEFACTVGSFRVRKLSDQVGGLLSAFGVFRSEARVDAGLRLPNQQGKGNNRRFVAWYEHNALLPPGLEGQPRVTVYAFALDENEPLFWLGPGASTAPFGTTPPDRLVPRTWLPLLIPPPLLPTEESPTTGPLVPSGYGWAAGTSNNEITVTAPNVLAMPKPSWAQIPFELRFQGWIRLENGRTHRVLPTIRFEPVENLDGPGTEVGTRIEQILPLEQKVAAGETATLIALYRWEPVGLIAFPGEPGRGDRDPRVEINPIAVGPTDRAALREILYETRLLRKQLHEILPLMRPPLNDAEPR